MSSASSSPTAVALGTDVELGHEAAAELSAWAGGFTGSPYAAGYEDYVAQAGAAAVLLPPAVTRLATEFGRHLGQAGAARLRGVPVPAGLRATPSVPFVQDRFVVGTEPVVLSVAMLVGTVLSFEDWHEGDRVQNLYPLRSEAASQNASNAVYLEMHTETAFRPTTPHALVLLCLRGDAGVRTVLCDLALVWSELDELTRAALEQPGYAFALPGGATTPPKPIAAAADVGSGARRFNYAEALVGVGAEHARALATLRAAIDGLSYEVVLEPGDLLLIDNLHVVHGRTAYEPRYDGTDRWLQRCLVSAARTDANACCG